MAQLMLVNPRKRRRKTKRRRTKARTITKYRYRSRPKRRVRRRRNPIRGGMTNRIINASKNGAIGSLGAITGTIVGNFLPIPATMKAGPMGMVVEALIGIGTGAVVGNFMNKRIGEKMAEGAVTVALHDSMKNFVGQAFPQLNLSGYDETLLGYDETLLGMGAYDDDMGYGLNPDALSAYDEGDDYDLGAYDEGDNDDSMGYVGPGWTGESESDSLDLDEF